jgi:hypothetical protein
MVCLARRSYKRKHFFLLSLMTPMAALSGCGERLGSYAVGNVQLVTEAPSELGIQNNPPPYSEFIRIDLTSEFNITTAETGPGLYADADFCPVSDWGRMIAFGPLDAAGRPVEDWKREGEPARRHKDGRFHYSVYLVPNSAPRKPYSNAETTYPGYDLRRADGDVCLRFFVPGYNITESESDAIKVSGKKIRDALAKKPAKN